MSIIYKIMINIFAVVGGVWHILWGTLKRLPQTWRSRRLIVDQIRHLGLGSIPIIAPTFFFAGAVVAYEAKFYGGGMFPEIYIGMFTAKALMIEIAPLLTGIMFAGRAGSSMAAEIATMRVTEQIDALETLAIDPLRFISLPRFVSSIIVVPLLTLIANFVGFIGGLFCAKVFFNVTAITYIEGLRLNFIPREFWGGLVKSTFFGMWTAVMSVYYGFTATGGAEGVGRASTRAVISSSILIIVFDLVVAMTIFR